MDQAARKNLGSNDWVRWKRGPERIRHRVQVVQVSEKLVEPVDRRQKLIVVAQVVLAALPGCIAHQLQRRRDRASLLRQSAGRTSLPDTRHTSAESHLA